MAFYRQGRSNEKAGAERIIENVGSSVFADRLRALSQDISASTPSIMTLIFKIRLLTS